MKTVESYVNGIKIVEVFLEPSDIASDTLKLERLAICKSCEYKTSTDTCSQCSCLLTNRVSYVESFCPVEKW